jgi:hypothetical protein
MDGGVVAMLLELRAPQPGELGLGGLPQLGEAGLGGLPQLGEIEAIELCARRAIDQRNPNLLRMMSPMRGLTADMTHGALRPYFLWDEDVSIEELVHVLAGPDGPDRDRLLGKMLREARDIDVWHFVRPAEVARVLGRLRRRIGRRHAFWTFLIEGWRADGLLAA